MIGKTKRGFPTADLMARAERIAKEIVKLESAGKLNLANECRKVLDDMVGIRNRQTGFMVYPKIISNIVGQCKAQKATLSDLSRLQRRG
jgi:hypothetical protein